MSYIRHQTSHKIVYGGSLLLLNCVGATAAVYTAEKDSMGLWALGTGQQDRGEVSQNT